MSWVFGLIMGGLIVWLVVFFSRDAGRAVATYQATETAERKTQRERAEREINAFRELVLDVYSHELPENLRFVRPKQIRVTEWLETPGMPIIYGWYDPQTRLIYLNMLMLKAAHNPAIYGEEQTRIKLREHLKYLLIHEGAHAKGLDHAQINAKIESGEFPIKF